MAAYRRLALATAFTTAITVLADAQTTHPIHPAHTTNHLATAPPAAIDRPLVGTTEVLDELRSVSYRRADGTRTYGIVAADVAKYFPTAVTTVAGAEVIDPSAMAAVLLSLVKDLKEANVHLNSQIEHVLYDKGELERRLHALEAEVAELKTAAPALAETRGKKGRRREATAQQ